MEMKEVISVRSVLVKRQGTRSYGVLEGTGVCTIRERHTLWA